MEIAIRKLTKKYKEKNALDEVTADFGPGQIVAVVGLNGAGKTSLLRCLATIAAPSDGEVRIDGEKLTRGRIDLRRRLHFVPDTPFLFYGYSVIRNLSIMLRLYERDVPGAEDRVMDLLADLDLTEQGRELVQNLSRGQAYKTGLAGLIAVNPELWILDEPFASGMDPQGISVFKREARQAADNGGTVIYSTQLLDMAEKFSDHICVLHQGRLRFSEKTAELKRDGESDDPALMELFGRLREES